MAAMNAKAKNEQSKLVFSFLNVSDPVILIASQMLETEPEQLDQDLVVFLEEWMRKYRLFHPHKTPKAESVSLALAIYTASSGNLERPAATPSSGDGKGGEATGK